MLSKNYANSILDAESENQCSVKRWKIRKNTPYRFLKFCEMLRRYSDVKVRLYFA